MCAGSEIRIYLGGRFCLPKRPHGQLDLPFSYADSWMNVLRVRERHFSCNLVSVGVVPVIDITLQRSKAVTALGSVARETSRWTNKGYRVA